MSNKYNDATTNRPDGERIIDAPTVLVDLPAFMAQIKSEDAWHKNDRNSITVYKTDDMRIVLGAMHEGAEMTPHKAEGVMCIQVLDGVMEINTNDLASVVEKGQMIAIHRGNKYHIIARKECIYLLTMSNVN